MEYVQKDIVKLSASLENSTNATTNAPPSINNHNLYSKDPKSYQLDIKDKIDEWIDISPIQKIYNKKR